MLHDHNWQIGSTESFALRLRERLKGVRDNGDGEPAAFLQFNGIVDTPRCAGPSIPQSADDKVGVSGEIVEVRFGRALLGREFASPHHACDIAGLSEQLLKTCLKHIVVGLAVVQQTYRPAVKICKAR